MLEGRKAIRKGMNLPLVERISHPPLHVCLLELITLSGLKRATVFCFLLFKEATFPLIDIQKPVNTEDCCPVINARCLHKLTYNSHGKGHIRSSDSEDIKMDKSSDLSFAAEELKHVNSDLSATILPTMILKVGIVRKEADKENDGDGRWQRWAAADGGGNTLVDNPRLWAQAELCSTLIPMRARALVMILTNEDLLLMIGLMNSQIGKEVETQRENIFHSRCLILGRLGGLSSERLVKKLTLPTIVHPRPYEDRVMYDVVPMEVMSRILYTSQGLKMGLNARRTFGPTWEHHGPTREHLGPTREALGRTNSPDQPS
ncbi:hypothetical protein CR513_36819, partial [Mucuna pruriens]